MPGGGAESGAFDPREQLHHSRERRSLPESLRLRPRFGQMSDSSRGFRGGERSCGMGERPAAEAGCGRAIRRGERRASTARSRRLALRSRNAQSRATCPGARLQPPGAWPGVEDKRFKPDSEAESVAAGLPGKGSRGPAVVGRCASRRSGRKGCAEVGRGGGVPPSGLARPARARAFVDELSPRRRTTLRVPLRIGPWRGRKTHPQVVARAATLLASHTAGEVAARLNAEGFTSGAGLPFKPDTVEWMGRHYGLTSRRDHLRAAGHLTAVELAARLRVSVARVGCWRAEGRLTGTRCNQKDWLYDPIERQSAWIRERAACEDRRLDRPRENRTITAATRGAV